MGDRIYSPLFYLVFCFVFCGLFCDCHVKRLLASYSVQRERQNVQVLNVAEVRSECVRSVCECVCVWRCVPTRCQQGGILKRQSLSSSSVILSLHSQMSEFCLPLSFFLLQTSHSPSCDRQHNKNTNPCLFMSTVGDQTIWECLNLWTVLN